MKKIITGKRYDTETAEYIGEYSEGGVRDFRYVEETLYRKRTGEFFLHGKGGPASRYAVAIDLNSYTGGEALVPISYEEAQRWVEEHLDAEAYEKLFQVSDDLDKTVITLSVPSGLADRLRKEAAKTGRSISDIAADAILKAINI